MVVQGAGVAHLIQVCSDVSDPDTRSREVRALLKAERELKCNNLLVITRDTEEIEERSGSRIVYVPVWKWLLQ